MPSVREVAQRLRRQREREGRPLNTSANVVVQRRSTQGRPRIRTSTRMPLPFNDENPPAHDLGHFDKRCRKCSALHWSAEKRENSSEMTPEYGGCCLDGKISMEPLHRLPPALQNLFVENSRDAKEFRQNIRSYNKAMAFTSTGGRGGPLGSYDGRGPPMYKIQGEVYHRIGALMPEEHHTPVFSQLFVYDHQEALQFRMNRNPERKRTTMETLQRVMDECNPFVQVYKQAHELFEATTMPEFHLRLDFLRATDQRRYNVPCSAHELAAIIPGDVDSCANAREVIIRPRGGPLMRVSECHPAYIAWQFPLLAPTAQSGWSTDLFYAFADGDQHSDDAVACGRREKITFCDFLKFRLHPRPGSVEPDHYFRASLLFQEFVVNMWAAAEHSRLSWIFHNQDTLRADLYKGVLDALQEGLDIDSIGRKIILPATFTSGPRFMHKKMQDALALLRVFGGSDLFITFTANPAWQEITDALLPNQQAYERPDLVARVFRLKFKSLLHDIMDKNLFGEARGYVYTVEYQKRGLPHVHLIVFLHPVSRLSTASAVDSVISTEFPDPDTHPRLFDLVKRFMVHGPCGSEHSLSCSDGSGRCTKGFPKPFQNETQLTTESYVKTRRRDTGRTHDIRGAKLDNRNIVSYSPYLLLKYGTHVNVECTSGFQAIKYIYKYIYKGPDRASITLCTTSGEVMEERDEIKQYIDARYVSSSEAFARISGWPTHKEYPSVVQLPVHLRDEQFVVFNTSAQTLDQVEENADATKLTAFFDANKDYPNARDLLYVDMPSKFVWDKTALAWKPRKKGRAFGRISFVPPTAGEKFYARLVLSVAKNLQSFDDLQSFDGVMYPTIREACAARGLLADDGEWRHALNDAKDIQTGAKLRTLFLMIVKENMPTHPTSLWNDYKASICDDIPRILEREGIQNITASVAYDYGLHLIENSLMHISGKSMKDVGLPRPTMNWVDMLENSLIREHLSYNTERELQLLLCALPCLNTEQSTAFNSIFGAALADNSCLFFLQGAAGAGKTFVYNAVCHAMRSRSLIVLCVASSGIASLLLPGGRTSHSCLKIPIDIDEHSTCSIGKASQLAKFLAVVKLLIWDECSMQHRHAFEAVDRTLKDIRNSESPFGGIPTVLGGDFLQILPVVRHGTRSDVVHAALPSSFLWDAIAPRILKLQRNMRLAHDEENQAFALWQSLLARGVLNDAEETVEIPTQLRIRPNTVDALLAHTYPGITRYQDDEFFKSRCILCPRNRECHEINDIMLDTFPGDVVDLWSVDSALDRETQLPSEELYPPELLTSLKPSGYPLAHLRLKIGAPIIILRNLQPREGLCNGTRGIVTKITTRVLQVRLLDGDTVMIPRIKLISTDLELPFNLHRLQFPVALSFAMTINKAQGQSFATVGIDLRNEVFSHGQLYVALSRGKNVRSIKCILDERKENFRTKNVVFREVVL